MKEKSKKNSRNRTVKNEVLVHENKQWNENWRMWEKGKEIGMQPENWCEGRERCETQTETLGLKRQWLKGIALSLTSLFVTIEGTK